MQYACDRTKCAECGSCPQNLQPAQRPPLGMWVYLQLDGQWQNVKYVQGRFGDGVNEWIIDGSAYPRIWDKVYRGMTLYTQGGKAYRVTQAEQLAGGVKLTGREI